MSIPEDPAEAICFFGKQLFDKGFAAANDGNLSIRLDDGTFLCTPTRHSKGLMCPADLCVVDTKGNQLSGRKQRSSEILLHLEIYRQRSDVNAVLHCHPPHATAFAIAGEPIPQCVLPEVEIFLGEVPTTRYATPGSQAFAESVVPFVKECNVLLLGNHGTVSFGSTMELAWWFTDILDAYCRTLLLARQLGGIRQISEQHCRELLDYKQKWGFSDLRIHGPEAGCNVCGNQAFRHTWEECGIRPRAFGGDADAVTTKTGPQPVRLDDDQLSKLAKLIAAELSKSDG